MNSNTNYKSRIARIASLVSFFTVLACPSSVFALGDTLPDQDAFATARGNAFVATANDPAAVFYNPAGITQLSGKNFSLGAYGIVYGSSYNSGAAGDIHSKTLWAALPQCFSTMPLPYGFTFGLGTYSPYGLRMEWPDNSTLAMAGQTGEIDYVTLNPVLAYKINSNLSVAVGPTLSYSEADFKLSPGFTDHFRGRDTSAGFDAGVLWHPWEEHSFGVTYRSANDMNYNGHASVLPGSPTFPGNAPATANFHFPQVVSMGYSYRPTTNWNFETDADWSDWTGFRSVTIDPHSTFTQPAFQFDWKPSWIFNFGGTRYLGSGWRLSSGFMYVVDTVPDNTFNPLIPDSDRYIFSVGVGKTYDRFRWDLAYQFLWGPTRTVSNDGSFPIANGSYEFIGHAISINFGYRF